MKIRKALVTVLSMLVLAGCGRTAAPEQTVITPDYAQITSVISEYEDSYREFVNNGEGTVQFVTATGTTLLGAPCDSKYSCSSDGRFESCSLAVHRDREEYDEYFNLSSEYMMFVRTYIDEEAQTISISKYISTGSAVYYLNDETQTCDPVEDVTAMDMFVTFDQVRNVFGADDDVASEETQLSA